jgi:hypothetical protein
MTAIQIFTVFAGILALAGAYLYFFGIDPETKRQLERQALKTMGENKMSYMAKGNFLPSHHISASFTNTSQTPSTRSPPRIKRTSRTSRSPSATPSVASPTTPSESKLVKPRTDSLLLSPVANALRVVVRAANAA